MSIYAARGWENPGAGRRAWGVAFALSALSVLLVAGEGAVSAQQVSARKFTEYQIKAAFVFNFMQFVEWPAGPSSDARTPLLIGVLGDDPFGAALEETIRGETVHGRPLTVRRKRDAAELKDCQLVFVCRSEKAQVREILGALRGGSILTVSDMEHFCRSGGMIGLVNEGGKVRFEINQAAAEQDNLKVSSKLLRLGRPAPR